ncbi:MAG: class I lanthipeptide [Kordia sp.]|uniref:class I lanthipeptide n=1 Tax=Kordia sp. TaxID=1965332 RepID=UPI003858E41E
MKKKKLKKFSLNKESISKLSSEQLYGGGTVTSRYSRCNTADEFMCNTCDLTKCLLGQ